MKLIDLIPYLKNPERQNELYELHHLNIETEEILIYMEKELSVEAAITLFEIEETGDYLSYKKNDIQYKQLLPLSLATELIEDLMRLGGYDDDAAMAKRLVEYAINDA